MGVLIYKTRGSFPDKFIMEAIDVLLMAKGSSAEVGYVTDSTLTGDLLDLNYEEFSRGLIHFHINMSTSFSSTDTEQLKLAASTGPYYLSVVVNNDMEFTAKVAIKSTTEGTVKSYFRNLSNKLISKPKTIKYDSYTIIEVEVEADYPQYMADVDQRIKDRLQDYITPNHHSPVGSGNSIRTNGFNDDWYMQHPNWKGQNGMDKPAWSNPKKGSQPELFTKVNLKEPVDLDEIADFVEKALDKYCRDERGVCLSPYICAKNISEDAEHYGISLEHYIGFLEENTFINETIDEGIVNALIYSNI